MNIKPIIGALVGYFYNEWIAKIPFHNIRDIYLRMSLGKYGKGSSVQSGCQFLNSKKVFLGKCNVINFGTTLDGRKYRITIGDHVSIGPEATILTLGHDPQCAEFSDSGGDVIIGDRVWIGYRAIILPGVTVGDGVVVGAGSIVTKDVKPYTIVAGNPAKMIAHRRKELSYELSFRPWLR